MPPHGSIYFSCTAFQDGFVEHQRLARLPTIADITFHPSRVARVARPTKNLDEEPDGAAQGTVSLTAQA